MSTCVAALYNDIIMRVLLAAVVVQILKQFVM